MIVRVKENKLSRISEKREFILYLLKIKHHVRIRAMLQKYIQHGSTTVYTHSRNVAYKSFLFAKFLERKLGATINYEILTVSAMFHDFFLYDWHQTEGRQRLHGFRHPKIASENAQKFYDINDEEKMIIESHMWPLTITKFPKTIEAKIICFVDKCCSTVETFKR
ncbi:MAG: phosphohydrolase [Clostridia bacterium]|nr:phosphohydrolase [Clostridia bacterium]MCI9275774.1 phosphohydrolase [Clostridia bacterium]